MYRIQTQNAIANIGLSRLDPKDFTVGSEMDSPDGILVRSADLHSYQIPDSLRAIARAGAGTNNIPIDRCSEAGIVVMNTPGANANAVKELVLCSMLMSSRDILGGIDFVAEQAKLDVDLHKVVEGGKSTFRGPELFGKTIGIIGLGAIGVEVANACYRLGMEVIGYDPFLSVTTALKLDRHVTATKNLDDIYRNADYITIHVPYSEATKNFIDQDAISKMRGSVRIINLARGELVNQDAILSALQEGRVARYVTDFPTKELVDVKNVIPLPHLGASTPDSEDNCAVMAVDHLKDYLEHGNIIHSINLPDAVMERSGICRLCLIHKNIPSMLSHIMNVLSDGSVNVENMINKSKGDYAYTMLDLNTKLPDTVANELRSIEGVIRVRRLTH
ncbi:MAG: phosphoglycerate dehydrogenase [Eubacteriales bacterium]